MKNVSRHKFSSNPNMIFSVNKTPTRYGLYISSIQEFDANNPLGKFFDAEKIRTTRVHQNNNKNNNGAAYT